MAHPKHDYDSPDFLKLIESLAMNGYNDAEIASELELAREVFGRMKGGNYDGWTEEENARRSELICHVLLRGRTKVTALVRGAFLRTALGRVKTKQKNVTRRRLRVDGQYTDDEEIQTTEGETEHAPNLQALSTWLYHHDPDWRKVERKQDEDASNIPTDISHGIDIDKWIAKEVSNDTDT